MEILTSEQMYEVEKLVELSGTSMESLMMYAGKAIFQELMKLNLDKGQKIAVICGKGNNGGDAIVVADLLQQQGYDVELFLAFGIPSSPLARKMLAIYLDHTGKVCNLTTCSTSDLKRLYQSDCFIDGVFGIGFSGELTEEIKGLFNLINSKNAQVFAIDIPSGLNANTGAGKNQALKATTTFALGALKPAHVTKRLPKIVGEVITLDIGISSQYIEKVSEGISAFTKDDFHTLLRPRQTESYKGTYGKLLAYCGSSTMMGAAIVATKAAYRTGAGMIYAAIPENLQSVLFNAIPEAISLPLVANLNHNDAIFNVKTLMPYLDSMSAILIGCGLNDDIVTQKVVIELIRSTQKPLVLDATALNILGQHDELLQEFAGKPIVITPHYGEMARLIGEDIANVQKYRLAIAKYYATTYQIVVVLKGSQTIVADPSGKVYIHTVGNQGLAKAGSGDALAGTIASFVTQGYTLVDAANLGIYLHGAAADLVAQNMSMHAMLITDVINAYGNVLK